MFKHLKLKLTSIFVIVGLLPLTIISILTHNIADSTLEKDSFHKLTAVRVIKKTQIENYFQHIRDQIITLSEDRMIVDAMNDFKKSFHQIDSELTFNSDETNTIKNNVVNYYNNEFLSRLNENVSDKKNLNDYLPEEDHTLILQNLYFASNPNPTGEKDNLNYASDGSAYSNHHSTYHPIIRNFLKKFGYYDIFLIDNKTGEIVYTVFKEVDFATSLNTGPYRNTNFARVFKAVAYADDKDFVSLEDFERYDPSYAAPASFIASPIFDGDEQIGVLAFQMPVEEINSIMTGNEKWKESGLGESGETYLVGADFKMRSNSRFLIEDPSGYLEILNDVGVEKNIISDIEHLATSILFQDVKTEAATKAINGNTGTEIILDYRNIPVLSSYSPLNIEGLNWAILSEIDESEAFASSNDLFEYSVIIAVISALFVIFIGFVFSKSIANPIVKLSNAASEVASGNIDVKVNINLKDEVGRLANSFNSMVQNISSSINEVKEKGNEAERAAKEAEKAEKLAKEQKLYLERNTSRLLKEMEKFSQGDLTVSIEPERNDDEIGKLLNGFNTTVNKIRNMMFKVKDAVQATASASAQISSSTEEMAAGSEEQSSQITEIAGAIEEMTSTIFETSNNANKANTSAKSAGEFADEGGKIVGDTVAGMNKITEVVQETNVTVKELGKSSEKIGNIVQVINEIADQTNLLALNAAIEAARAGEHGRGFSVVADEVKKLAERTTVATNEIADMIKQIQKDTNGAVVSIESGKVEVESGRQLADEAGKSLHKIISASKDVVEMINMVAIATKEQSTAAEQISRNVEQINTVINESSMGIQQISMTSNDLNQLTENLHNLINEFKIEENTHFFQNKREISVDQELAIS